MKTLTVDIFPQFGRKTAFFWEYPDSERRLALGLLAHIGKRVLGAAP